MAEPGPPFDPDAAREAARRILERPEFQPPSPPWWERAIDWFARQLDRLFPDFGGPVSGGGGLAPLLGWVVLAALLGVTVWFVVRSVRRQRRSARPAAKKKVTSTVVVDHRREPDQWRVMAVRHAAAGEWRDALRCRYRALVGDLARRGLLDEIPGRTTGEERAQLASAAPPAAPTFADATDLFDRAWYGDEPAGPVEHDRFAALEHEVLARAGETSR